MAEQLQTLVDGTFANTEPLLPFHDISGSKAYEGIVLAW
jgi:hypothetical protein